VFAFNARGIADSRLLRSIVIRELEKRADASSGSICVCYVYFRYSDDPDLTVRSILEILVKQTIERHHDCALLAEEVYVRHSQENTQPTEVELLQLLYRFRGSKSLMFYVLEALDEAPDKLQLDLITKLASLDVRLFITSRPLKGVENCFSGAHSISIFARGEDLELHITAGINRSSSLQSLLKNAGPSLREEIVHSIKHNCHGM
jgi:ankyrin repeat domain-containing protein 50